MGQGETRSIFGVAIRDVTRLRKVASVVVAHGFGEVLLRMPFAAQLLGRSLTAEGKEAQGTAAERFTRLLGALGPTYIKLGQLLSMRGDLLPAEYVRALATLQDRAPVIPLADVQRVIEAGLGQPLAELFDDFVEEPLATASIGQIHQARTKAGQKVVVKVQRPGIGELAAADVALMRLFARMASAISVHARRANVLAVIEDFETNLVAELDFANEARRMREFNDVMRSMGTTSVAAPEVYDELSGRRVLTMERFDGWRLDDTVAIKASPYDAEERLITGIRAWFQTLISRGFFHGDVHAGNFMLLKDGRIGYLDFGIVGVFDESQKKNVLEYVLGFQDRDFERVGRAMLQMGTHDDPDAVDFPRFIDDLVEAYSPLTEAGFSMKDLVPNLIRVSRKHSLRMPRDLVLVTKQLVYLDRYSRAYGGDDMNVLTDQRLSNLIMQDMLASMFAGPKA